MTFTRALPLTRVTCIVVLVPIRQTHGTYYSRVVIALLLRASTGTSGTIRILVLGLLTFTLIPLRVDYRMFLFTVLQSKRK